MIIWNQCTGHLNHSLDIMTQIKIMIGRKMIGGSDRTWLLYPTLVWQILLWKYFMLIQKIKKKKINMRISDVLNCSFSSWYPKFKDFTTKRYLFLRFYHMCNDDAGVSLQFEWLIRWFNSFWTIISYDLANNTLFDLITAHTPISAQSRNSVVFRL